MDDRTYVTGLAIAQVLPGANPVNVALYFGQQAVAAGWAPRLAVFGMVVPAFCIILMAGFAYRQLAALSGDTFHAARGRGRRHLGDAGDDVQDQQGKMERNFCRPSLWRSRLSILGRRASFSDGAGGVDRRAAQHPDLLPDGAAPC